MDLKFGLSPFTNRGRNCGYAQLFSVWKSNAFLRADHNGREVEISSGINTAGDCQKYRLDPISNGFQDSYRLIQRV